MPLSIVIQSTASSAARRYRPETVSVLDVPVSGPSSGARCRIRPRPPAPGPHTEGQLAVESSLPMIRMRRTSRHTPAERTRDMGKHASALIATCTVALMCSIGLRGLLAGGGDDSARILTVNHYVRLSSTVPALAGQPATKSSCTTRTRRQRAARRHPAQSRRRLHTRRRDTGRSGLRRAVQGLQLDGVPGGGRVRHVCDGRDRLRAIHPSRADRRIRAIWRRPSRRSSFRCLITGPVPAELPRRQADDDCHPTGPTSAPSSRGCGYC